MKAFLREFKAKYEGPWPYSHSIIYLQDVDFIIGILEDYIKLLQLQERKSLEKKKRPAVKGSLRKKR